MKYAPNRDKIVIWCAVTAGCGMIALLLRQAAIHKFGADAFTGNIFFVITFVLSIGLYLGFQTVVEEAFKKVPSLFQRKPAIMIAETTSGKKVQIEAPLDETAMTCQEVETAEAPAVIEQSSVKQEFEVLEIVDNMRHIRFDDGSTAYVGMDMTYDEIIAEKEYHDYEHAEIMAAIVAEEEEDRYIEEVEPEPQYKRRERSQDEGFFSSVIVQEVRENPDGTQVLEDFEEDVYVSGKGYVYSIDGMDPICDFYEKYKDQAESHKEIIQQKSKCDEAFHKLKRHDEMYNLEQVSFICAYITYTMEQFMEAHELDKLHHNAKIWTINADDPDFAPVRLRSNHLSKEDLKHLGYNVGKFMRLQGKQIAKFVKQVFVDTFGRIDEQTITAKLAERNPAKDRIPLLSAKEMGYLFDHYKRYRTINPDIIAKRKAEEDARRMAEEDAKKRRLGR